MLRNDRLGMLVVLVMLGLMISGLVELPQRDLTLVFLGSELTLSFSGAAQLGIVLAGLVCAGVDQIIRGHPMVRRRSINYTMTFWVLPGLLTISSLFILDSLIWWGYRVLFIVIVGVLLAAIVFAEYHSIDPKDNILWPARWGLNAAVYLAALVFFVSLYGSRLRSAVSATGILAASAFLALDLFRNAEGRPSRIWTYALLTGLLMGELTWALNYCSLDARTGGALLLLAFYLCTGLTQQSLWGRLNQRVLLEYGTVGALGLATIVGLDKWFRG